MYSRILIKVIINLVNAMKLASQNILYLNKSVCYDYSLQINLFKQNILQNLKTFVVLTFFVNFQNTINFKPNLAFKLGFSFLSPIDTGVINMISLVQLKCKKNYIPTDL